jgi:DNA repair protein RadD
MNNFQFRPHQEPSVKKGIEFFTSKKPQKPTIHVQPTGAGKSYDIAGIAQGVSEPILILQPSIELLYQNVEKFEALGGVCTIYSAGAGQKEISHVTYGTLGTVINSLPKFIAAGIKNVIVDECHLYPSDADSMFGKLMKGLGKDVRLLGLTASPFRLVSNMMGSRLMMLPRCRPSLFKEFGHITQIKDLADKYWTPVEYRVKQIDGSVLRMNSNGSDYSAQSLEAFSQNTIQSVYEALMSEEFKHVLCFVSSVSICKKLCRIVPDSAYVCADTPPAERSQIVRDFKSGKLKRLLNVGVFRVGFDYPELDHVIDAAPTMSLASAYQKFGRLVRTFEGKKIGVFTDLAGMVDRFGKIEELTIEKKAGSQFHEVYSNGKQLTGVILAGSGYTMPTEADLSGHVFNDMEIDFGKNKGKKISECEGWYLSWVRDNLSHRKDLVKNINYYMQQQALKK